MSPLRTDRHSLPRKVSIGTRRIGKPYFKTNSSEIVAHARSRAACTAAANGLERSVDGGGNTITRPCPWCNGRARVAYAKSSAEDPQRGVMLSTLMAQRIAVPTPLSFPCETRTGDVTRGEEIVVDPLIGRISYIEAQRFLPSELLIDKKIAPGSSRLRLLRVPQRHGRPKPSCRGRRI